MRRRRKLAEDSQLFEQLFRMHYADVLAYARRRASADVALDAVADTFLVTWRRIADVPEDALPWLLAVARRSLANQTRSGRRRDALRAKVQLLERPDLDSTEAEADAEIFAALRELSDAEREAILLIAWEGLTPRQAARSLGCSNVAFRARLHRARRRLTNALADNAGGVSAQGHLVSPREEPS